MGIADLIRPRWKHSNPEIRLLAVQEMGADSKEKLQTIASTDTDSRVRIQAVLKIYDKDFLNKLYDLAFSQGDVLVAEAVKQRLNIIYCEKILKSDDARISKEILEKIDDEKILTDIACQIIDPEIRLAASEKITNPDLLCKITESNCGMKTGMAIVQRLSNPEHLKRVSKHASNKKIKKQAVIKLDAVIKKSDKPASAEDLNKNLENLCVKLEKLHPENIKEASQIFSEIKAEWENFSPDENHPLNIRFEQACVRIEEKLKILQKQDKISKDLESLCIKAEQISTKQAENTEIENLKKKWNEIDIQWLPGSIYFNLNKRFKKALDLFYENKEKVIKEKAIQKQKLENLEDICIQVQKAADIDEWQEFDKKWNKLKCLWEENFFDAPEAHKLKQDFDNFFKIYEQRKKDYDFKCQQELIDQEDHLEQLCKIVEQAIGSNQRLGLDNKVKKAQQEWKETGELVPGIKEKLTPRFNEACNRFFAIQREYWENIKWERWANLNQKTELCQIVEKLAQSEQIEGIAKITREAQSKWKQIGPVSKDQAEEIWKRFNNACDKIYQRCLAEKTKLYSQLKDVLEPQSDENDLSDAVNWAKTSEKVKFIQSQWNSIGSLPLALEKELRYDFQDICNTFFENRRKFYQELDKERLNNLNLKTDICQQAEALALSENWNETAVILKDLQKQWKEIGPVPKEEGDDLWSRFQTACNQFFDRMQKQEPENLKQKQALCVHVEELIASITDNTDMDKISKELISLQKQWKEIGPVPIQEAEAVWKRFHDPCDAFFTQRKEFFKQREAEYEQNKVLKEELIAQAEILSKSKEWKETSEKFKEIQKSWKEIGPASRKVEQELWVKFRTLCDNFFNTRKDFFESLDKNRQDNLRQKENLCLSLEALARLVLPEHALDRHKTVPAAEHLSIALEYKNEIIVPGNQKATWDRAMQKVKDIQKQWKNIGPVPSEEDDKIWKRFRSAADIFFSFQPAFNGNKHDQKKKKDEHE